MKKIILLFVVLSIILSITACEENAVDEEGNDIQSVVETLTKYDTEYIKLRNGLNNTYSKLKNDNKLTVAYIGGSITAGAGASKPDETSWRSLTTAWIKSQFPDAEITEVNMGIGSVGSLLPVFYLDDYVCPENPDLVFIETAVNDYLMHYTSDEISTYYETIVRKLLTANPYCDIVAVYTINDVLSVASEYYEQAEAQDKVAEHYGIPSANVGRKIRKTNGLIEPKQNGEYTMRWKAFFGDEVHPTDAGHKKYAEDIAYLLESAFTLAENIEYSKKNLPEQKNKELLLNAKFIPTDDFDLSESKGWSKSETAFCDGKFGNLKGICTATADNELCFEFTGENFYILSSTIPFDSTADSYQISVDGGDWKSISPSGANPKMLAVGLENKKHTVRFKIGAVGENAKTDIYKTFSLNAVLVY